MILTPEKSFALALGLSRATVREKRAEILAENLDWRFQEGRVELTPTGCQKLRNAFGLPDPENEQTPASAPAPLTEDLICIRSHLPNTRIILCETKTGLTVRVRVKDSASFTIGMAVPATHLQEDLWEYTGRLPRQKGRW